MPATVLCARADMQINHGGHKYGANQSWWCPGFDQVLNTVTVVGSKPLQVEHEIDSFARYVMPTGGTVYAGRYILENGWENQPWERLVTVARYEAPAPEVQEPTGLGAVVRDAEGVMFTKTREDSDTFSLRRWVSTHSDRWENWANIAQPVTVLSEGVEL